jgi:hypothetical protein
MELYEFEVDPISMVILNYQYIKQTGICEIWDFTTMKIQVAVFWIVTPRNDVTGYPRFEEPCCIYFTLKMEEAWLKNQNVV